MWFTCITHGSQKDARNIEQGFALGHKNINCLQEEAKGRQDTSTTNNEVTIVNKTAIKLDCETKRVPLDLRVPDKVVMIS
jgi:hypothetical protein